LLQISANGSIDQKRGRGDAESDPTFAAVGAKEKWRQNCGDHLLLREGEWQ
jgi:hypothetical protein